MYVHIGIHKSKNKQQQKYAAVFPTHKHLFTLYRKKGKKTYQKRLTILQWCLESWKGPRLIGRMLYLYKQSYYDCEMTAVAASKASKETVAVFGAVLVNSEGFV